MTFIVATLALTFILFATGIVYAVSKSIRVEHPSTVHRPEFH